MLDEIGEQISLRQFDISDRDRDRVSAMVQVMPWDTVGFNFTASVGQDTRPDAVFGLQDNDMRVRSRLAWIVAPRESFSAGASYAFENYSTLQRSRQANPGAQFNDPARDWQTDMDENVHTWSFSMNSQADVAHDCRCHV